MAITNARLRILLAFLLLASAALTAQVPVAPVSQPGFVAVHATTPTELRGWDSTIDRMVRTNELVVWGSQADPDIEGRSNESLDQYYRGIPVFGGSLSHQT